jgi:hypothetical protein
MPALEKRRVGVDVLVEVDAFELAVTAYLTYLSWYRHDLSWIHLLAIPHAMIDTILGCMRVFPSPSSQLSTSILSCRAQHTGWAFISEEVKVGIRDGRELLILSHYGMQ